MEPLAVQHPSASTLESRGEGRGDGDQDQVPLSFVISFAIGLCQNHGQFERGGSLNADPSSDRPLTYRLFVASNDTHASGRRDQHD